MEKLAEETIHQWLDPVLHTYKAEIGGGDPGFHAAISISDWVMSIRLAEDYRDRIQRALHLADSDVEGAAANTGATLYLHEVGHWKYAPFDSDGHERILAGLTAGLKAAGRPHADDNQIHTLANMFTDILVNTAHATLNPGHSARSTFQAGWKALVHVMLDCTQQMPPEGLIFLLVQQRLLCAGDSNVNQRLNTSHSTPDIQRAVERLHEVFCPGKRFVLDRECWEQQAKDFAFVMAPFLRAGKPVGCPIVGDNVFTQRCRNDPVYRRELIRRACNRPGAGDPLERCGWAERTEVLRILYEEQADAIALRAAAKEEPTLLPITHTAVQRVEPGQGFDLASIKWSASRWYPTESWQWYRRVNPLSIPSSVSSLPGLLPDLLFILDSSGSMAWNRTTDVNRAGAYDLALLALFGIYRWLCEAGIGPFLRYAGVNFSDETLTTRGWRRSEEFDVVFEVLLRHQGGETRLDPQALRSLHAAAADRFWAIMISDGELANGEEVLRTIQDLKGAGNLVTLLQLGKETAFARRLRQVGGEVRLVREPADLVGLALGATRRVWSNG